jgi:hypothetical protein
MGSTDLRSERQRRHPEIAGGHGRTERCQRIHRVGGAGGNQGGPKSSMRL